MLRVVNYQNDFLDMAMSYNPHRDGFGTLTSQSHFHHPTIFFLKGFLCQNKHPTLISPDDEECLERYRGREPFMSLIQVVQGHRAQCTLVDCSPRIHRSFLFPDTVQAAQPWGAWQSMTSPLFVCVPMCALQRGPNLEPSAPPADCKPSGLPAIQAGCLTLLTRCAIQ